MANSNASVDLTQGPIWRHMFKIAIPVAIAMIVNTLYALTDTYFAGKISTQALAGLSMTFPVYILMIAVGAGVGQGTTALVSNQIGASTKTGEPTADLAKTIGQALTLSFVLGVAVALFIRMFGTEILTYILPDADLVATGMIYINAVAFSAPFMALSFTANGIMTAQGKTNPYKNIVIIGFVANLFLDPYLALDAFWISSGLGLGLKGIAYATVIVQVFSAIAMLLVLRRSTLGNELTMANLKLSPSISWSIIREGFAASMNMLMIAVGALILQYLITPFGDAAVAGQGVGLRINQLFLLPLIGLSSAVMAIAGQANGAGMGKRVLATYAQLLTWGVVSMVLVAVYIGISAPFWSRMFSSDPEVQRLTVLYLYVTVPMMPIWAFIFISQSFCQSLKKPYLATWVNIIRQIPFPFIFVPLAHIVLNHSALSVWIGISFGNVLGGIALFGYCLWIAPTVTGTRWSDTKLFSRNES